MSAPDPDPHCPECGESIGQRATYCMHCSADLTEERAAADADADGAWDQTGSPTDGTTPAASTDGTTPAASTDGTTPAAPTARTDAGSEELLDPDGLVDNSLTVVVGIAGGLVIGFVGTFLLAILTGSGLAVLLGVAAWLGATAHLVRRRTVQGAVARSGYGLAIVLLAVPLIALSPVVSVDGGLAERGIGFVFLLVFVAVPAGIAAGVGWLASRFVPEDRQGNRR